MNFPRTLIMGIDGATFDVIKPWAAAGRLPTFADLLKTTNASDYSLATRQWATWTRN